MFEFNTASPDAFVRGVRERLGQACRVLRLRRAPRGRRPAAAMSADYDGIILGAGHNSLVLQAYLGRAGLKTLCLERRDVAGGGLATHRRPAPPRLPPQHALVLPPRDHRMPWYRDLELERRGAATSSPS